MRHFGYLLYLSLIVDIKIFVSFYMFTCIICFMLVRIVSLAFSKTCPHLAPLPAALK